MTTRGTLRVYLGMAPGAGKTYSMLGEGQRRKARGSDIVVAYVETYGRKKTEEMLRGLEVVPRRTLTYRGATFTEMDLDAVLARRPQIALVDELAHTNVPGSKHDKRWQDVEALLDAGITVISTVNVQHLESLNDVVERITGVKQRERIPDEVVRRADQIELVDITPEALRRRMAHGNIYPAEKIDAALTNYFRTGNLTALRELALLWVVERVDEGLQRYRNEHGITQPWEARERIVVGLTGGPEGDTLIRRAARVAARTAGAQLLAVHAVRSDELTGADPAELASQRTLIESLGGSYHQVVGDDVARTVLEFARARNATQIILGASRRGRLETFLAGEGIGATITRLSGPIDVHMVTHQEAGGGHGPRLPKLLGSALTMRRRLQGALVAAIGLPLLTLALTVLQAGLNLSSEILLYLLLVVGVALVGGFYPALAAAVAASLLLNYFFTPPVGTFTIAERNNALALLVFVVVAAAVSAVVERAARRTREAARAAAEATTLATLAGSVLQGANPLAALLDQLRETFGFTAVSLLERPAGRLDETGWQVAASVGRAPPSMPGEADVQVPVSDTVTLAATGPAPRPEDLRVLSAFAAQAATALERQRLTQQAEQAQGAVEADRMRTALLAAVSHDLRSPLASAKAAVGSLRSHDVTWTPQDREELLATADESLDRLIRLVENLLDLSRLQAGALSVFIRPVALDELIPLALDDLGPGGHDVAVQLPEDLPECLADAALLERVVANLIANALRHSPPGSPPLLSASTLGDRVELHVVDHGPGIAPEHRDQMFAPFQRLGDTDNTTGVGLGLALSRGLTEAMGGSLTPQETPGGGLTMIVSLPSAGTPPPAPPLPTTPPHADATTAVAGAPSPAGTNAIARQPNGQAAP
jgi:two-component system sensor histidine kinase KdpD